MNPSRQLKYKAMNESNFDTIEKKNVLGHDELRIFYIIAPLGFQENVYQELLEAKTPRGPLQFELISKEVGGVEISCLLSDIPYAFISLRSATRIIMRLIDQSRVRDLPRLFHKISKFPWNQYLRGDLPIVHVTSRESRLFDSRKIEKAVHDGIQRHYQMNPTKKKYLDTIHHFPKNQIFLRFQNDDLTLSIDLTGDRLDRRKEKLLSGMATIRETLAHNALMLLWDTLSKCFPNSSREYDSKPFLIDPFCGSGTIIIESMLMKFPMKKRLSVHPLKDFENEDQCAMAFFKMPIFEKLITHEEYSKFIDEIIQSHTFSSSAIRGFLAIDSDQKSLENCQNNFIKIHKDYQLHLKKQDTHFACEDSLKNQFIKKELKKIFDGPIKNPIVILTNPPYGERIEGHTLQFQKNALGPHNYVHFLLENLLIGNLEEDNSNPISMVAFILPTFYLTQHKIDSEWTLRHPNFKKTIQTRVVGKKAFSNGGIEVELIIFHVILIEF